ncbi:hypothetical protein [Mucilaginibacter pedocola]|uniref:Uncharacterized protein n=1 Tax=Mucilaginibacter pedocola TaxID=1792845 RepID=A0A1S9P9Z7_9SPHI|nr:hypothetical protein [Mucilaginibacter pedocola]OOQ57408.1 hypothetical protein BC343_15025 [Mucilaginibacter pedocola]
MKTIIDINKGPKAIFQALHYQFDEVDADVSAGDSNNLKFQQYIEQGFAQHFNPILNGKNHEIESKRNKRLEMSSMGDAERNKHHLIIEYLLDILPIIVLGKIKVYDVEIVKKAHFASAKIVESLGDSYLPLFDAITNLLLECDKKGGLKTLAHAVART